MFMVWLLMMWVLPSLMLKLDGLPLAVSVLCLVGVRVRQLAPNLRLGEGTTTTTCALATGVLRAPLVLSSPLRMLVEVQLVALQLTSVVVRVRDQQWVWEMSMVFIMVVLWSVMTLLLKAVTQAAVVIKVSERRWTRKSVGAWVTTCVWALAGRRVRLLAIVVVVFLSLRWMLVHHLVVRPVLVQWRRLMTTRAGQWEATLDWCMAP
jgi:hypothetical protein